MASEKYLVDFNDGQSRIIEKDDIISRHSKVGLKKGQEISFWLSEDGEESCNIVKGVIFAVSFDHSLLEILMNARGGKSTKSSERTRPLTATKCLEPIEIPAASTSARIVHESRVKKILDHQKITKESPLKVKALRDNQKDKKGPNSWIADQVEDLMRDLDQAIALEEAGKEMLSSAKQKLIFMNDAIYEPPKNEAVDYAGSQNSKPSSPEIINDIRPTSRRVSYKLPSDSDEEEELNPIPAKKQKLVGDYGSSEDDSDEN
ncbi:hypothetical protein QAD02_001761 [Eretmocerus hayati]|uniref:Uncharacterized protein n=2 Tax=Eretmocerus hayati TaxID=131215 RepID=A0ACC2NHC1_9HYME|nr:hypothetical protein QAD02_006005 [Eretmocerus hayati]KAJ8670502.1 hypothetical protein QAD02_001761 [Eretmocerus hayati]